MATFLIQATDFFLLMMHLDMSSTELFSRKNGSTSWQQRDQEYSFTSNITLPYLAKSLSSGLSNKSPIFS